MCVQNGNFLGGKSSSCEGMMFHVEVAYTHKDTMYLSTSQNNGCAKSPLNKIKGNLSSVVAQKYETLKDALFMYLGQL